MAPGTRDCVHCVNMTGAFQQHRGTTMDTLIAHVLRRGNSGWNKSYWLVYWSCIWNPEASSCKVGQSIWAICSKISVKFVVQSWQRITVREQLPVASVQCQPIFILSVNCDIRCHEPGTWGIRWGMGHSPQQQQSLTLVHKCQSQPSNIDSRSFPEFEMVSD